MPTLRPAVATLRAAPLRAGAEQIRKAGRPCPEGSEPFEQQAWRLRTEKHKSYRAIAGELDVCLGSAYQAVQRVRRRLADSFEQEAKEICVEQAAQLDESACEVYRRWRASCRPRVKRQVMRRKGKDGKLRVVQTVTERRQQNGDARLMRQWRALLRDIREVMGAGEFAPVRDGVAASPAPVPASAPVSSWSSMLEAFDQFIAEEGLEIATLPEDEPSSEEEPRSEEAFGCAPLPTGECP